jgi:4'-phosphopantetheinyl transferase
MENLSRYFGDMCCPDFRLENFVVHVWRVFLPELEPYKGQLESVISDEERAWAQRFRLPDIRSSFILRRGFLRTLIQNYTEIRADRVEFCHSAWGKPELLGSKEVGCLQFNTAHSRDSMILAFGKDLSVGVDLEYVDKNYPVIKVATRFFTPQESATLREAESHRLVSLFFEIWVRKEAFLKAIGRGLSLPLDSFEVPLNTGCACAEEPPIRSATMEKDGNLWFFSDITFSTLHKACLATSPPPSAIRIFDWHSCAGIKESLT